MKEQAKILRVLKMISLLSEVNGYGVHALAESLKVDKRTVYRYIKLLQICGFIVDQKLDSNHYFIHSPHTFPLNHNFSMDEVAAIKKAIAASNPNDPLLQRVLTKIYESSDLPNVQNKLYRARLYDHVKHLEQAMDNSKQVILRSYHSSHSGEVRDRLVEPILLKEDYTTLLAYDINGLESKFFKLDRIAEVILLEENMAHKAQHQQIEQDIFGMSGKQLKWISCEMSLRAYNLMREEIPAAIDYLVIEEDRYFFKGPCRSYEGIGRFILGLPGDIWDISDKTLVKYLQKKMDAFPYRKHMNNS